MSKTETNKVTETKPDGYTLLPTVIQDKEYIKDLEFMVSFLADSYQVLADRYFYKHMKTASITNPDRRDLTESEKKEWMTFPLIQGHRMQSIVKKLSEQEKEKPTRLDDTVERFTNCR